MRAAVPAPVPAPDCLLYRVPVAAGLLQVSTRKLWSMIRARELPVVRIGTRCLIDRADLLALISARKDSTGEPRKRGRPRKVAAGSGS